MTSGDLLTLDISHVRLDWFLLRFVSSSFVGEFYTFDFCFISTEKRFL